jgi:SAM-dependent methyltransferase
MVIQSISTMITDYKWYHKIKFPNGETTVPENDYSPSWHLIDRSMEWERCRGQRILDIGCRDGLWSLMAEQAGADSIIAIDTCLSKALKECVIPSFNSKIKASETNLFELQSRPFDLIFFFGVLYHLRYPFLGLKKCLSLLKDDGTLFIETSLLVEPRYQDIPLLYCPTKDGPYDATSCSFFNLMGLNQTLTSLGARTLNLAFASSEVGNPKVDRVFLEVQKTQNETPDLVLDYWHQTHSSYDR